MRRREPGDDIRGRYQRWGRAGRVSDARPRASPAVPRLALERLPLLAFALFLGAFAFCDGRPRARALAISKHKRGGT